MDFITVLGFVAATLTTIAFLPQVLKVWQTRSADDLSWSMLTTFGLGVFLWLVYGLMISSPPVIAANALTLMLNLILLLLKGSFQSSSRPRY